MLLQKMEAWRRRLDHITADPRPDVKSFRQLFAEMATALLAAHEREELILARMPLQALSNEQLRDGAKLEDLLPAGRATLPPEGLEYLLMWRKGKP